jgi:hypothetical protein
MTAFTKESATGTELVGKLYKSNSGWILLKVPNAFVRGIFDSMDEPGIELPPRDSEEDQRLNAHISVMRPEELESIGGPNNVTERGRDFRYTIGKMKSFNPRGWAAMSKCWVMEVKSPELEKLRKSYGLTAIPGDGGYPFHITVAVRRAKVLQENEIAKEQIEKEGWRIAVRLVQMDPKSRLNILERLEQENPSLARWVDRKLAPMLQIQRQQRRARRFACLAWLSGRLLSLSLVAIAIATLIALIMR